MCENTYMEHIYQSSNLRSWNERFSIVLFMVETTPSSHTTIEVIRLHADILWNNMEVQLSACGFCFLFFGVFWALAYLENQ